MDVCRFRKKMEGSTTKLNLQFGDIDHEPMVMSLDGVKPRAQGQ